MGGQGVRWLWKELPGLVAAGVMDEETADRLRRHYGPPGQAVGRSLLMGVLAGLGAACVGLGVILIFAHNWDSLPRSAKTGLAFAPLLFGQALAAWVIVRRGDSWAWREGAAAWWVLSVGACIALVSQTWHIQGELDDFLLTWLVLGIPAAHLLNSSTAIVLALAGILSWTAYQGANGASSLAPLYWTLMAAVLPHLWWAARRGVAARVAVVTPALAATMIPGLLIILGKTGVPMAAFGVVSAVTSLWVFLRVSAERETRTGSLLVAVLAVTALTMTFRDMHRTRWFNADQLDDAMVTVGVCIALAALSALTVRRNLSLFGKADIPVLLMVPVTALSWPFAAYDLGEIPSLAMNLLVAAAGLSWILLGFRDGLFLRMNSGLALLAALMACRFFDSDIGLLAKGVAFVGAGAAFLVVNLLAGRRTAERTREDAS
ncbi:MAG: DUF2157 domain-containing protein [Candidatus Hydrogenedentes bacterium]|nr:DUF2157 domain-containing protein [Candidatus Hydrogenedentota bacterium]